MNVRRFLFLLFAALVSALGPPGLVAQTSGTITNAQCAPPVGVTSQATVLVKVSGTWTGTLQPEISVQGQPADNVQVTPTNSSTAQPTITANGSYYAKVAGGSTFLLCGSTVTSGTANVYLNPSPAVAVIIPPVVPVNVPGYPENYLSWQPGTLLTQTCSINTFTLTGARQNLDFVSPLWPSALPANLSGMMRVSASDVIEVRLCNPTAASVTFSAALIFGAKLFR
jgi:hypothetical protein